MILRQVNFSPEACLPPNEKYLEDLKKKKEKKKAKR